MLARQTLWTRPLRGVTRKVSRVLRTRLMRVTCICVDGRGAVPPAAARPVLSITRALQIVAHIADKTFAVVAACTRPVFSCCTDGIFACAAGKDIICDGILVIRAFKAITLYRRASSIPI